MADDVQSLAGGNPFLKISRTLSRLGNTFSGRNRFKPVNGTRRRRIRKRGTRRRGTRSRGGVKKTPTKRKQSYKVRRRR